MSSIKRKVIFFVGFLVVFTAIIFLYPKNTGDLSKEKLCEQAIVMMEKRQFDPAIKVLGKVLILDQDYPKANYVMAVAYLRKSLPDTKKAVEYRDKAKKLGYQIPQWFDDYLKKIQAEKR
jgi:hypothetical protein